VKPTPKQNRRLIATLRLKAGDVVKVIGCRPGKNPPGFKDELGTEALFKRLVGRRYRIEAIDEYGFIELRPRRLDFVWIEPDLVEPVPCGKRSVRPTAMRPEA